MTTFKNFFKSLKVKLNQRMATTHTIRIYMKSGNVVELDGVSEGVVFESGNVSNVCSIKEWQQMYYAKNRILLNVLDLTQIEAVVFTKE